MAKMTQKAVRDMAAADVRGVVPPPLEQLEKTDWADWRRHAQSTAAQARLERTDLPTEHADTYIDAYTDALVNKYAAVVKTQERKRNAWRSALRGLTLEQATEKAQELLRSFNVRGATANSSFSGCMLHIQRAFALEADLYVRFERSDERVENPDNEKQVAGRYTVKVELSWGSTGRDVAGALAAATLYRELAEIGAEVEVVLRGEPILWTWGVDEAKEAVAQQ